MLKNICRIGIFLFSGIIIINGYKKDKPPLLKCEISIYNYASCLESIEGGYNLQNAVCDKEYSMIKEINFCYRKFETCREYAILTYDKIGFLGYKIINPFFQNNGNFYIGNQIKMCINTYFDKEKKQKDILSEIFKAIKQQNSAYECSSVFQQINCPIGQICSYSGKCLNINDPMSYITP